MSQTINSYELVIFSDLETLHYPTCTVFGFKIAERVICLGTDYTGQPIHLRLTKMN